MADNTIGSPQHQRQYVDFRVVVYRMTFKGKDSISLNIDNKSQVVQMNSIIGTDFSDDDYVKLMDGVNKDSKSFQTFLKRFYLKIKAGIEYGMDSVPGVEGLGANFFERGVTDQTFFERLDITPLVQGVNSKISLYDTNSCELSMLDPVYTDFSEIEMSRYFGSSFGPVHPQSSRIFIPGADDKQRLTRKLQEFRFREFDLIRVYSYSRVEMTGDNDAPSERMQKLREEGIDDGFAIVPSFTGLVATINRTATASQMPTMSVQCMGMSRVLAQSVTIFNEQLANVITGSEGDPNLGFLANKFRVTENVFQMKSSDQVFQSIIKDYFRPKMIENPNLKRQLLGIQEGTNADTPAPLLALGIPDLDNIIQAMFPAVKDATRFKEITESDAGKVAIIPFLPTLILYHLVKMLNREPIVYYDDRLDFREGYMTEPVENAGLPAGGSSTLTNGELTSVMNPYLAMIRQNFEFYDSNYTAPWEILDTIRNTTYFEIFEDRTGAFHFRFPRYNAKAVRVINEPGEIISASFTKDDTAVYNTPTANMMYPLIGAMKSVPGRAFIDRLSILKYGMRMPQVVQNPNATTIEFMRELARFSRDFYAGKESRRATVIRLLDPTISPGDMVSFRMGRIAKLKGAGLSDDKDSYGVDTEEFLVGYVTEVRETMSVSGQHQQVLNLEFVRLASGDESLGGNDPRAKQVRAAALSQFKRKRTVAEMAALYRDFSSVVENMKKVSEYVKYPDKDGWEHMEAWLSDSSLGSEYRQFLTFKAIPSALLLAKAAVKSSKGSSTAASVNDGKGKKERTKKAVSEDIASVNAQIKSHLQTLASFWIAYRFLNTLGNRLSGNNWKGLVKRNLNRLRKWMGGDGDLFPENILHALELYGNLFDIRDLFNKVWMDATTATIKEFHPPGRADAGPVSFKVAGQSGEESVYVAAFDDPYPRFLWVKQQAIVAARSGAVREREDFEKGWERFYPLAAPWGGTRDMRQYSVKDFRLARGLLKFVYENPMLSFEYKDAVTQDKELGRLRRELEALQAEQAEKKVEVKPKVDRATTRKSTTSQQAQTHTAPKEATTVEQIDPNLPYTVDLNPGGP